METRPTVRQLATKNGKSRCFELQNIVSGVCHFRTLEFGAGAAFFVDASHIGIQGGMAIFTTSHSLRNHAEREPEPEIAELARRAAMVTCTWHIDEYDQFEFSLAPHLGCVAGPHTVHAHTPCTLHSVHS